MLVCVFVARSRGASRCFLAQHRGAGAVGVGRGGTRGRGWEVVEECRQLGLCLALRLTESLPFAVGVGTTTVVTAAGGGRGGVGFG